MKDKFAFGPLIIKCYPATFTSRSNDFYGRVEIQGTLDVDDLVDYIVNTGCEISPETLRASIDFYERAKADRVLSGYSVNTPTVRMYPACRGSFTGEQPVFQRPQHRIVVKCVQSASLRKRCDEVEVVVGQREMPGPHIEEVTDYFTGKVNSVLTPGKVIACKGRYIALVGDSEENGYFLIQVENPEVRIRFAPSEVIENRPSQVRLLLPADLPEGRYQLEVVTQMGTNLKHPVLKARTCRFLPIFTVER